jgi:hypothetical protein
MDKKLKETLSKALDRLLQHTLENTYLRVMDEALLDDVKSKENFLFGIIVGDMLEGLGFCMFAAHKRSPKDHEFRELFRMIHERAGEIDAKTRAILASR